MRTHVASIEIASPASRTRSFGSPAKGPEAAHIVAGAAAWEDRRVHDDAEVVAALRRGDEAVFADLVDRWGPAMLRVARVHVPSHAIAEEVVQETWLAVLQGLSGFERRSSLRGWVFAILLNRARSRGKREHRVVPFAALRERFDDRRSEPAVAPERFQDRHGERPGWWATPPARWADPAQQLETAEARAALLSAVADLPPRQREVLVLRDILGMPAEEAASVLGVSEGNQRVLLHRARSRVRAALEPQLAGEVAR
jgi:RNA polymerase sigma-70 factor (ECF subfamily)